MRSCRDAPPAAEIARDEVDERVLARIAVHHFADGTHNLEKWEEILLIPLGKAVEEVLIKLKEDGIVKEEQVLMGFPHPSGANVNRVAQFEANRDNMIKFIKKHFI